MNVLKADSLFYQSHASDADIRRDNRDTSFYAEKTHHFIDLDDYPNFRNLPRNLDTLIRLYGWERVKQNGINPWVTAWLVDSLTAQIKRGDAATVRQTMSDIGHYVGDAHQPLHCTANFNGQFTNNGGIHSRYESSMVNAYQSLITVHPDSVHFVGSPLDFVFDYIYTSNLHVDSIMQADNYAKSVSGWNGSGTPPSTYYEAMWERTSAFTIESIQRATVDLACLWYTAWVNAQAVTGIADVLLELPELFYLKQNYPNPFNPTTEIEYTISAFGHATLRVFDVAGKVVATLVNEELPPGEFRTVWDASGSASGIYFVRMNVGPFSQTRKIVFMR
jgi:hypothetical protein